MGACCSGETPVTDRDHGEARSDGGRGFRSWLSVGFLLFAGGLAMTLSLAVNLDPPEGMVRLVLHGLLALLAGTCVLVFGWPIMRAASRRGIHLETLFFVAITGTFAASVYSSVTGTGHIYYEVVIILLAIHRFGRLVKERQAARARDPAGLIPGLRQVARLRRCDGSVDEVSAGDITPGDRVEVRLGEFVPVDGSIVGGEAFIEELAHTGEPFPCPRGPGDRVLAGMRVLDGVVVVEATAGGKDREIDRIASALEKVPETRVEWIARRVLRGFVPTVLIVSVGTFLGWWLLGGDVDKAIFHALAVTIVACPCGLGLAIPLAARRAKWRLWSLGVEPRESGFLDQLARVDSFVFDKTGTLTHPRLELERLSCFPDAPADLRSWLVAIQRHSTHPVARAFWSIDRPADLGPVEVTMIPARGVEARFEREGRPHVVTIGNDLLRRERESEQDDSQPGRVLHVYVNGTKAATAELEENLRESAMETIAALRRDGCPVVLLTGDSAVPSAYRDLVDEARSGLTALEKATLVEERKSRGQRVLFVGDGLNDVDALQAADASIALVSGGSAASAAAGAVLHHDDLSVIPEAVTVARDTFGRLKRLLGFVLVYNALGIVIAALGLLHPVAAALLMLGSSATAIGMAAGGDEARREARGGRERGETGCRKTGVAAVVPSAEPA